MVLVEDMTLGAIYYSDAHLDARLLATCQAQLQRAFDGEIIAVTLQPMRFGTRNIVIDAQRSYPTMVRQIITGLEASSADYVYWCEHDILYPAEHFRFTPPSNDVFHYNANVWRWWIGRPTVIRHDRMLPLSVMCCCREFALDHYRRRQRMIAELGWNNIRSREPRWARRIGYEPGTKKMKRGGFSDDDYATWESAVPVIDIRHRDTFSSPKLSLADFTHAPKWFTEMPVEQVNGWDLQAMFKEDGKGCQHSAC